VHALVVSMLIYFCTMYDFIINILILRVLIVFNISVHFLHYYNGLLVPFGLGVLLSCVFELAIVLSHCLLFYICAQSFKKNK